MRKSYIGIDIGKQGSIAHIKSSGEIITYKMPKIGTEIDERSLSGILDSILNFCVSEGENYHVIFEKLGVIYGSSKQTAFSMGEQYGTVKAMCVCKKIPYTPVRAVEWQKTMFTGVDEIRKPSKTGKKLVRDTKGMALIAIQRIFPDLKLTFGDRASKPDDNLIDSVLIAEYGKRMNI